MTAIHLSTCASAALSVELLGINLGFGGTVIVSAIRGTPTGINVTLVADNIDRYLITGADSSD
jgi:hypothetical protein